MTSRAPGARRRLPDLTLRPRRSGSAFTRAERSRDALWSHYTRGPAGAGLCPQFRCSACGALRLVAERVRLPSRFSTKRRKSPGASAPGDFPFLRRVTPRIRDVGPPTYSPEATGVTGPPGPSAEGRGSPRAREAERPGPRDPLRGPRAIPWPLGTQRGPEPCQRPPGTRAPWRRPHVNAPLPTSGQRLAALTLWPPGCPSRPSRSAVASGQP